MQADLLHLDIIAPVLMYCALLWWVGRGMSWTARLVVTAVTIERSGF
jgi:hypothetical protein